MMIKIVSMETTPPDLSQNTSDGICTKTKLQTHTGQSRIVPTIPRTDVSLLFLLGFGGISLLIAGAYKSLRKYVFHDEHSLDTVFDAGGHVSLSLTAVTVTSQMLWPGDFLQSSTLMSKSGLGASLWMAVAVVIDILLFPALSLYLKTRAPGAKTFPQIAYARFGKCAHIIFCTFALITNVIVCANVLLAGKSAIESIVKDANAEFIYLILAFLFGSYCMIGGLGSTFYISYFNTALTFLSISFYTLYTNYYPTQKVQKLTSIESMYDSIKCLKGPDGNYGNSFLTFRTESGLIFGLVMLFMATSISFCDQANWQSRIAAKPSEGVVGFFFAAYMWFVIPTTLSFTVTMSYFTISFNNGSHMLSETEIDNGFINPFVMTYLLGDTGGYLLLIMLTMALMSTGSGEVMAISSIVVYDIYKTYINPFRMLPSPTSCILCGKEKLLLNTAKQTLEDFCVCPTAIGCRICDNDIEMRISGSSKFGLQYKCQVHGKYRHYEDGLLRYKTWCMVWVVILLVPFGLLLSKTDINLNWTTMGIPCITCSFIWPLFITIAWSRATSKGVISGTVAGLASSIAAMLIAGSMYKDGLSNFFVNTVQDYSLISSMSCGFIVSGVFCIAVSLCTHKIKNTEDADKEWSKTINIDNPLNPFRLIYLKELRAINAGPVITAKTMDRIFQKARKIAVIGAVISLVLFLIIIPTIALSIEILTLEQLTFWMRTFQTWLFLGTFLVVVVPPVEEGMQIWKKCRDNKKIERHKTGKTDESQEQL